MFYQGMAIGGNCLQKKHCNYWRLDMWDELMLPGTVYEKHSS